MPNLFSNLIECLGFSQIMKSTFFKTSIARKLMSSRLPMGVLTICKPFFKLLILLLFTVIISCAPQNYLIDKKIAKEKTINNEIIVIENKEQNINKPEFSNTKMLNEIEIILPKYDNQKLIKDFINAFELSLYKKKWLTLRKNHYSSL